jgi:hypothetical protein
MTTLRAKTCSKCKTLKLAKEYSKGRNKDGYHSYCKPCMKEYSSKWWKDNGEDYHYLSSYGLTREQVSQMLNEQEHKCALCSVDLQMKQGFKDSAHVDHCHTTGTVRGILCGNCNTSLGKLGDSVESIQRVLDYLKKSMI